MRHTDFASNVRVQAAKDNVTVAKLGGFAFADDHVSDGAYGGSLLPPDGIAVLLAGRAR